jgi:lipopolysaccharide/colanic/teichoic acid biosynthesis glycosyltransferase
MIRSLRLLVPASILAMFLCETALLAASYLAAVYLDRELDPQVFLIDQTGWLSISAAVGLILLGMHFRQLYGELRINSRILLFQELSLVMGGLFIAEALMTYFQSRWALPRNVLFPGSGIALAAVYTWRVSFSSAIRNRLGLQRVLFIGFPPAAEQLTGYLERHPETGFAPVGYLNRGQAPTEARLARLGSPGDLRAAIEQHHPDWIVIGGRHGVAAAQVTDLVELRFGGVWIEDVERFFERATGRVHAASIRSSELVLRESLLPNPVNLRFQYIYATLAVLLAIPIVTPLLGGAALALRMVSRRPVFLRELRVGLSGATFIAYRFQTGMGIDRYLARVGLERWPQIWNVLRGEMSLVGPEADRPEFSDWLNQKIPSYSRRLLVCPGLIGWAQIHERTDMAGPDAIRRLEYDLYYIKNLSPLLDLFVVLRWFREALSFSEADRPGRGPGYNRNDVRSE